MEGSPRFVARPQKRFEGSRRRCCFLTAARCWSARIFDKCRRVTVGHYHLRTICRRKR
jgi:hypothetical protein